MKEAKNLLLPDLVLLDFVHQRKASVASKKAYRHLENILNITKYIPNSKLVNVEVQSIKNEEIYEELASQPTNKNNVTISENIPFKRSSNTTKSSHLYPISKSTKYIKPISHSTNHNEHKFNNNITENLNSKSSSDSKIVTDLYAEENVSNLYSSTLSSDIKSYEEQIDTFHNNYNSKKILISATTSPIIGTKENLTEYVNVPKNDITNITLSANNLNNKFIKLTNDSQERSINSSDLSVNRSVSYDKIISKNDQRESLHTKEYYKNEQNIDGKINKDSIPFDVTTSSVSQVHAGNVDIKKLISENPHVPTFESNIAKIKNSYTQNSFGEEGKPILTQNNVSFYFNDISSSVVLSIGISFAFALILFVLAALWIIKRKKYHSKVYLSYELAKPRSRHISKPVGPMPPSILPGEMIVDNQSISEIESPREPLFLQEEKLKNLNLNKRLSNSMENCSSGIDNPAYIAASTSDDPCMGKQIRPTYKAFKKDIAKYRRSTPKYTKKRKSGSDFPVRVCSSDGSIFPASPSLTRCLVPPPPYSPSIRNESKMIFTLPAGNANSTLNIDCESSH